MLENHSLLFFLPEDLDVFGETNALNMERGGGLDRDDKLFAQCRRESVVRPAC